MKYDSKFEQQLHEGPLKSFKLHPYTEEFTQVEKYTPDFCYVAGSHEYIIEAKAYLYTGHECKRYTNYRKTLGTNRELIFIFQDPNKSLKWKKSRQDGTKMTLLQWANKNKFRWFTSDTLFMLTTEINKIHKIG